MFGGYGWDAINYSVMPLLLVVAAITVWYALGERTTAREAA